MSIYARICNSTPSYMHRGRSLPSFTKSGSTPEGTHNARCLEHALKEKESLNIYVTYFYNADVGYTSGSQCRRTLFECNS
jgi:hypothetical protein